MIIKPLTKSELEKFFTKDAINLLKYFLFKAIFSQPELMKGQDILPVHVPKEHIEQWLVQCLGADPVGSGSYPVDIVDKVKKYGADAKMLSWGGKKNGVSGETSLAQKFKDAGNDLDEAFKNKKFSAIVKDWSKLYKNKIDKVFEDFTEIKKIYYFFVIRENNNFHICGMHVNEKNIKSMKVDRHSDSSIWIKNVINSRYGCSKIYKAKKRMELRLYPHNWIEDNLVISFDNSQINMVAKNLHGMNTGKLYEHAKENFLKQFKLIVGDPKKH